MGLRSVRKATAVVGAVLALILASGSAASAWTWATTSSPLSVVYNGATRGQGAGTTYRSGYTYVYTDAKLRDTLSNGWSIYEQTNAYNSVSNWQAQTGRRSGSTWASMNRTKIYSYDGWVNATAIVKVCEDAPLRPDICSTSKVSGI